MSKLGGSKAVLQSGGKFIIIQRDNKPGLAYANMWDFPGGRRERNETPLECLIREVREELSIQVKPDNVLYERRYESKENSSSSSYFFVINITKDDIDNIQFGNEGQGWKLVTVKEFFQQKDIVPFFKTWLRDYLEH
jgi:8-oxo-dGTP diphosphatase